MLECQVTQIKLTTPSLGVSKMLISNASWSHLPSINDCIRIHNIAQRLGHLLSLLTDSKAMDHQ